MTNLTCDSPEAEVWLEVAGVAFDDGFSLTLRDLSDVLVEFAAAEATQRGVPRSLRAGAKTWARR